MNKSAHPHGLICNISEEMGLMQLDAFRLVVKKTAGDCAIA